MLDTPSFVFEISAGACSHKCRWDGAGVEECCASTDWPVTRSTSERNASHHEASATSLTLMITPWDMARLQRPDRGFPRAM